ncbi:MAG: putative ABC transporter ATP-binding protein YknY [Myxococcota bacterium]|nr:putative ABC transporter ATP-binding protein YknY [Myxococcota bacterium]
MPLIEMQDIRREYHMGDQTVHALRGVEFSVERGESLSIVGPSGSGKSTLMNMLGCLDTPTSGAYRLNGVDVGSLSKNALAEFRNRQIGFIFQSFHLLPRFNVMENVGLPMLYAGVSAVKRKEAVEEAIRLVGLSDRAKHKPNELSGGQRQRVAIARALVNKPSILLADEPTGNLDQKVGWEIIHLFQRLNEEQGVTLIVVTHDMEVAKTTRRRIEIVDGLIRRDAVNERAAAQPGESQGPAPAEATA